MQGRSYEAGVAEYLQRALVMMRRKQLPERLCEQAVEAFGNPATLADQRALAAAEAQKNLGLSEAQLVCLLFAPFVEKGATLERFLRQCHPGMLVAMPDLHRAMQGQSGAGADPAMDGRCQRLAGQPDRQAVSHGAGGRR